MAMNYVWIFFFGVSLLLGVVKFLCYFFNRNKKDFQPFFEIGEKKITYADPNVFESIVQSTFDMSVTGFEIAIGLTGVLTLWMGLMKIGEKGGAIKVITWVVKPFFSRLFPELPKNHPVFGSIMMNFSANMLGLDNAATPAGLKAMEGLQELNNEKEKASNSQIMFLVLNTSGLTLIPVSVLTVRAQQFAELGVKSNPANVFIPILIATFIASLVGVLITAAFQKIKLKDWIIWAYIGGTIAAISGFIYWITGREPESIEFISNSLASVILFGFIILFIGLALRNKVNVYEAFIEGAKGGFQTAIKIIPFLIAILVAIGVFRASGGMDLIMACINYIVVGLNNLFGLAIDTQFIEALPTAIMKPLSGSGARGMMVDAMDTHGPNSFIGNLACTLQGSTDTTFYILAVYFGSVGIKNTRNALGLGLIADLAGIIAAILIGYIFYTY
tara:strand:- start:989 stop:2323 length:1335 start_codon:yes stop_codon:yes gene_type:complete